MQNYTSTKVTDHPADREKARYVEATVTRSSSFQSLKIKLKNIKDQK